MFSECSSSARFPIYSDGSRRSRARSFSRFWRPFCSRSQTRTRISSSLRAFLLSASPSGPSWGSTLDLLQRSSEQKTIRSTTGSCFRASPLPRRLHGDERFQGGRHELPRDLPSRGHSRPTWTRLCLSFRSREKGSLTIETGTFRPGVFAKFQRQSIRNEALRIESARSRFINSTGFAGEGIGMLVPWRS